MPKHKKAKAEVQTPVTEAAKPKGRSVISHERKKAWEAKPADALDTALTDALLGSETALLDVAHENAVAFRWAHLNRGMQRMALGNVLRGKLRRNEPVQVAGQPISA